MTIRVPLAAVAVAALVGCGRTAPPAPVAGVPVSATPASAPAAAADVPAADATTAPALAPIRLGRAEAVRLALEANRAYLQKASARERARLGGEIARSEVYAPRLTAQYVKRRDELDTGDSRLTLATPVLGFDVTPFATTDWDERASDAAQDAYTSAIGVTVSHRLLTLADHVRQRLPITQADTAFLAAANDLLLEAKRLELDVQRAFFAAQNARARTAVRERRVADAREFLRFVSENVRQGFKAPVEELFASISLNQAEADLVRDRTAQADADDRLVLLLARAPGTPVELVAEDVAALPPAPAHLEGDVRRVREGHEDLATRRARLELQRARIRVARDATMPELTAGLTAERRWIGPSPFEAAEAHDDAVSLSLALAMPLDLERGDRARLAQERREHAESLLEYQDAEARLERDLRAIHRRIERLLTTVRLSERRLEAERARLEATLRRYEAGAVDNLEVTRAKQELDDTEVALLDARIEVQLAVAEYRAQLPAVVVPADGR